MYIKYYQVDGCYYIRFVEVEDLIITKTWTLSNTRENIMDLPDDRKNELIEVLEERMSDEADIDDVEDNGSKMEYKQARVLWKALIELGFEERIASQPL